MNTLREDWYTDDAEQFAQDAVNAANASPHQMTTKAVVCALLSIGSRIAELTQEIRRDREWRAL